MRTSEAAYQSGDVEAALRLALDEGDVDGAVALLRRSPDPHAVVDVAYLLHAAGRSEEALEALAAAPAPDDDAVLAARVAVAEAAGRHDDACDAAAALVARRPDDVRALLDHADLALRCGRHDEAVASFGRLRTLDADDGHAAFACYGRAEAFARAGRWRAALDAALTATRADRGRLATDLLACVHANVFGGGDGPAWDAIAPQLAAARQAHRRLHAEAP